MGFNPFKIFSGHKTFIDFRGATDWHSHILPGVDDGISELGDSLKILERYEELGFRRVWLTPHIMEDMPNTPAALKERYRMLMDAYDGSIEIRLAAENMMDQLFVERLGEGEVLPIGDEGNSLLVETSYFTPPMHLDSIIESVFSAGYFPVLAHPERYVYMEMSDYNQLHERGVRMQFNIMSLSGNYGKTVCAKARRLLEKGYYDRVGSDIHRVAHLDILSGISADRNDIVRIQNIIASTLS